MKKGFRVIGIDANPSLCDEVSSKYDDYVRSGQLTVLNCGVGDSNGIVDFYLDTRQHTTSTFVPQPNRDQRYKIFAVNIRTLPQIFSEYGQPDFVKVDVEGYDFKVLKSLYDNKIIPKYMSVEAHTVDVLCLLVLMGFDQFKVVRFDGQQSSYKCDIRTLQGQLVSHKFEPNCSGPFGDDLGGRWLQTSDVFKEFYLSKSTWRDVHAKSTLQLYLDAAKESGIEHYEKFVQCSFEYWNRYNDVAVHPQYGIHGSHGFKGARIHYETHGIKEHAREWIE